MSKIKMFQIIQLAAYYEKILTDDQIKMYAEDLDNITDDETILACKLYRQGSKNEFFPRPMAKLVELIKKPFSTDDMAQQISSALLKAVVDYGYIWADGTFKADHGIVFKGANIFYRWWEGAAQTVIGKEGIEIVRRYGGWKQFCETVSQSPDGVIRQQITKLASSLINVEFTTEKFQTALGTNLINLIDHKGQ